MDCWAISLGGHVTNALPCSHLTRPSPTVDLRRLDLYWADPDIIPLLVQENYLNHRPAVACERSLPSSRPLALSRAVLEC